MSCYSPQNAQALRQKQFDIDALGKKGLHYEKLDQLVIDLLLGVA
jgi:xylose isomerase